jgi:hypothetical protein
MGQVASQEMIVPFPEMAQRGTSFWQWSQREWVDILCPTSQDYLKKYGCDARQSLMDLAYFLGGITDLREVDQAHECTETARSLFGVQMIEHELHKILTVFVGKEGRGYSESRSVINLLRQALSLLFILNRSPYLEDISREFIQTIIEETGSWRHRDVRMRRSFQKIFIALQELGFIERQEQLRDSGWRQERINTRGIPEEWVKWNRAWLKNQPKVTTRVRAYYYMILCVGRWLVHTHPEIVSPEQWG